MIVSEKSWDGAVKEEGHDTQVISFDPYIDYYNFFKRWLCFFELIKPHLALQATSSVINLLRPVKVVSPIQPIILGILAPLPPQTYNLRTP